MINRQQLKDVLQKVMQLFSDFQTEEENIKKEAHQRFKKLKIESTEKKLQATRGKIKQL